MSDNLTGYLQPYYPYEVAAAKRGLTWTTGSMTYEAPCLRKCKHCECASCLSCSCKDCKIARLEKQVKELENAEKARAREKRFKDRAESPLPEASRE